MSSIYHEAGADYSHEPVEHFKCFEFERIFYNTAPWGKNTSKIYTDSWEDALAVLNHWNKMNDAYKYTLLRRIY